MDLMAELVRLLEERAAAEPGASRHDLDREIARVAAQAGSALYRAPDERPLVEAAPKRVATAMALAMLSAPHFSATIPRPIRGGVAVDEPHRRSADPAPIVANEALEKSLGLSAWEIDELREEVDRRAGKALKLLRTVNWLWSYFQLPSQATEPSRGSTLARVLFPGAEEPGPSLVRRGGHLYLALDLEPVDQPIALFLPWLAPDPALGPTAFRSRSVDAGLRHRIARGVGGDDDEIAELLESMVALVPRKGTDRWLQTDQWGTHGYAALTDLGATYSIGDWLVRPLSPDAADWRAWIRSGPEGLRLKTTPAKVFDALALPRVSAMTRLVYAATLASVDRDASDPNVVLRPEDVDLLDIPRHIRAVLQPLMAWSGRASTHRLVAKELGAPIEDVVALFAQVQQEWHHHASASWWGAPGSRAPSIQTLLLEHTLTLNVSLRALLRRAPDPRAPHADMVLLFAAHYLREARIERLWLKAMSDVSQDHEGRIPPPEDIAGAWFWRIWNRLLDELDRDPSAGM
ncbi:MAG: hypothetical protein KC621_30120 [Myxococcales bacterium]|nr:hypothetical protein [Myxococcales bacterium]